MARGRKRKSGPRHRSGELVVGIVRRDNYGPTKQTMKKLTEDPLWLVVQGSTDRIAEAANEISRIWFAIAAKAMSRGMMFERRDKGTEAEMPDGLGWAHANVYVPWTQHWGRTTGMVIDLIVDREPVPDPDLVHDALRDYARRRWRR